MRAVFTQRHHEIIAAQISQAVARVRYIAETEILRTLVNDLCAMFRQDNRNFSSYEFRRWCGLPPELSDPVALATIDWGPLPADTVVAPLTWVPYQIPDPTPAPLLPEELAQEAGITLVEDDVSEDGGATDAN